MDWDDLADDLDGTIDDHLRVAGAVRPAAGGPDLTVRVHFERPQEAERFDGIQLVQARPWVEISRLSLEKLAKGDHVLIGKGPPYVGWRVATNPVRPGDGRNWRADVDPLGVVEA